MYVLHAQPVKDWNGDSGERWVIHQSWLDRMLQAFGDAAIEAAKVRPGETVLDIGCGAGTTSFSLAEWAGVQGRVTGIDISARSEEHTSELQSLMRISYAVFCLKKKKQQYHNRQVTQ